MNDTKNLDTKLFNAFLTLVELTTHGKITAAEKMTFKTWLLEPIQAVLETMADNSYRENKLK